MFEAVNLYALRNTDFIQLMNDTLMLIKRSNPEVLKVVPQYDNLSKQNVILGKLYAADAANPITAAIIAADARRDAAVNGIGTVILAYTYHFDANTNIAAKLLNNHLAGYGAGIARLSYQSETTVLTSILDDWKNKPDLAAAITFLNLNSWVAELETANNAFSEVYIDRTQDIGAASTDKMKAKRADTITAFNDLRNRLGAFLTISEGADADVYTKIVNELNALVSQYNRLLTNRGGGDAPPTQPTES